MKKDRKPGGFGLVETLIALVLVGAALLIGTSLLWQEHRVHRRLRAQQEAMWAMEASLDRLRGGLLPLDSGPLPEVLSEEVNRAAENLELALAVEPGSMEDLFDLTVSATYTVFDDPRARSVRTQIWAP